MVVSEGVGCGTSTFELKKEISLWFVMGWGRGALCVKEIVFATLHLSANVDVGSYIVQRLTLMLV